MWHTYRIYSHTIVKSHPSTKVAYRMITLREEVCLLKFGWGLLTHRPLQPCRHSFLIPLGMQQPSTSRPNLNIDIRMGTTVESINPLSAKGEFENRVDLRWKNSNAQMLFTLTKKFLCITQRLHPLGWQLNLTFWRARNHVIDFDCKSL